MRKLSLLEWFSIASVIVGMGLEVGGFQSPLLGRALILTGIVIFVLFGVVPRGRRFFKRSPEALLKKLIRFREAGGRIGFGLQREPRNNGGWQRLKNDITTWTQDIFETLNEYQVPLADIFGDTSEIDLIEASFTPLANYMSRREKRLENIISSLLHSS